MSQIFEMMLHIADENARDLRYRERQALRSRLAPTAEQVENVEWRRLQKRLEKIRLVFGVNHNIDLDEDDAEYCLQIVGLMKEHGSLTITEIMRELQARGVLSREFIGSAREQVKRLVGLLSRMKVAQSDANGSWRYVGRPA